MEIKIDDLRGPEIAELLAEHLRDMYSVSPPESVHALDLEELRKPDITFWSLWSSDKLAGCGALKELDVQHAEVKSMRTSSNFLRKGVARTVLQHIVDEAKHRGYQRLSLETGPQEYFKPARILYERFGFQYCDPFADYHEDPYSVFMTKELQEFK
jgi:putative acetyltransferase